MNINFNAAGGPGQGPLGRIIAAIVGVVALAATFMFGLVVFAVLAVVVFGVWIYFWWKTRALRKIMRETMESERNRRAAAGEGMGEPAAAERDSTVIEGEAVRVQDDPNRLVR